jgi:hypothetical protein
MEIPGKRAAHGLHVPETSDLMGLLRAWRPLLPPTGVFTGLTAADAYELWLPWLPETRPLFVAMGGRRGEVKPIRPELRVSRHPTEPERAVVDGVPLASPAELLIACGRYLGLLDLTVLVDCVLSRRLATLGELRVAAQRRRRGAPLLRQALLLCDGLSESPWETILRLFHVAVDVAVTPQHVVYDERGAFVARADLHLVGTRTLHEYDGAGHRDAAIHRADLIRERRIIAASHLRRGYTSDDLRHRALEMLRDCDQTLGRRHDPRRLAAWHALIRDSLYFGRMPSRLRVILLPRPARKLVSYHADSGD